MRNGLKWISLRELPARRVVVLAAAEAAIALAIFLNFYNNFSTVDVERANELKG